MIDLRAPGAGLQAAARTDPGRVRTNNEDLPLVDVPRGIFGVIDGVGGEAAGEVAAATARDVILQRLSRPAGTPAERVREAIALANNEIYRRAEASPGLRGMACVVTLALVEHGRLTVGHVGDSRLYKLRGHEFRKLTRDHSPIGEREDAGEIPEADAMRHPRRNEVFRDVGSVLRDKDDVEFVDVTEEPLEADSAILVCSDGLSDMLPSGAIAHLIRQYAGEPSRVVDALVAAANDAGGKDNVTAVYAEGPLFGRTLDGSAYSSQTPTEPLPGPSAPLRRHSEPARSPGLVSRAASVVVRSRITWFIGGLMLGLAGALALTLYVARTQVQAAQTRVVSTQPGAAYLRIADAMNAARAGDTVLLEPGTYIEAVTVTDGVDLVARLPGSVTIIRPAGLPVDAPVLTASGPAPVRISGVRLEPPHNTPAEVGIRINGGGAVLELLELGGPFERIIELGPGSSVNLRGSRMEVAGTIIAIPADAQASFVNNLFVRTGTSAATPMSASAGSRLAMTGNVFSGFQPLIVEGLGEPRRREVVGGNLVFSPPPARPRPRPARR